MAWGVMAIEIATGLLIGLSGVVVVLRRRLDLVGILLVCAGMLWFAGSLTGPRSAGSMALGQSLQFAHRAVLVHAAAVAVAGTVRRFASRPGSTASAVRFGFVLAVYVISVVRPMARSVWLTAFVGLVVCVVLAVKARRERASGRDLAWWWALAGFALWCAAASVLRLVPDFGVDERLLVYDVGSAVCAVALAQTRLPGVLPADVWTASVSAAVASERVLGAAVHDPGLRLDFSDDGHFRTPDGSRLEPGADQQATLVDAGPSGQAMIVHRSGLLDDRRLRNEVVGVVRLLAEQDHIRRRVDEQAAAVGASRDRLARAEDRAAAELATEIDRRVLSRVEDIRANLEALSVPFPEAQGLVEDVVVSLAETTGDYRSDRSRTDLVSALREVARRSPIAVSVHLDPVQVDAATARALLFVASESVANATKHSNSERIEVRLAHGADGVSLTIADAGTGGAWLRDGGGLAGLDVRMVEVGGRLAVRSPAGGGTVVTATCPSTLIEISSGRQDPGAGADQRTASPVVSPDPHERSETHGGVIEGR